jgi:hypothetical protein
VASRARPRRSHCTPPALCRASTTLPPLLPQVLIFVHSRKETAKTARYLKDTALANEHLARFMRDDSASREILQVGWGVGGRGGGEAGWVGG